jgi:hypothetical protein
VRRASARPGRDVDPAWGRPVREQWVPARKRPEPAPEPEQQEAQPARVPAEPEPAGWALEPTAQ